MEVRAGGRNSVANNDTGSQRGEVVRLFFYTFIKEGRLMTTKRHIKYDNDKPGLQTAKYSSVTGRLTALKNK
jgi:hypothetical protein